MSEQLSKQNASLTCSQRFLRSNTLEQLGLKWENMVRFRNLQKKLENEVLTIPGRDYQHSLEMQKILKHRIKSIDVFLLLFSGATTRYVLENLWFLMGGGQIITKIMSNPALSNLTWQTLGKTS